MTPQEPQAPATIGTQPQTAAEVNALIGMHLRSFLEVRGRVGQDKEWLAVSDLKAAPYYFTDQQEAVLKSAITDLDTVFDGIDLTFISQIVGM